MYRDKCMAGMRILASTVILKLRTSNEQAAVEDDIV